LGWRAHRKDSEEKKGQEYPRTVDDRKKALCEEERGEKMALSRKGRGMGIRGEEDGLEKGRKHKGMREKRHWKGRLYSWRFARGRKI